MTPPKRPASVPPGEDSVARQLGIYLIVLSLFLGSSGFGIGLGWLLWKKAGFPWWTLIVTSLLGLVGACIQVVRYQRSLNGEAK